METILSKITDQLNQYQTTIDANPTMQLSGGMLDEIYKLAVAQYCLNQTTTTPAA